MSPDRFDPLTASPPPVPAPFFFNAWVLEWIDGDTVRAKVDRGDRDYSTWVVRLFGCAALELSEPGGRETLAEVSRRWPVGTPLVLATLKPDKYGERKLARVIANREDRTGTCDVAWELIDSGWAAVWSGQGRQPRPQWPRVVGDSPPR